jgi:hypothetical protein
LDSNPHSPSPRANPSGNPLPTRQGHRAVPSSPARTRSRAATRLPSPRAPARRGTLPRRVWSASPRAGQDRDTARSRPAGSPRPRPAKGSAGENPGIATGRPSARLVTWCGQKRDRVVGHARASCRALAFPAASVPARAARARACVAYKRRRDGDQERKRRRQERRGSVRGGLCVELTRQGSHDEFTRGVGGSRRRRAAASARRRGVRWAAAAR